ncbi:DUF7716 domain-containing protein [Sphingopyxis sp. A083]|uniref:DUF7716 domain-containing protein n=1 Tax=Sphingopyxis sp. A083 TaxID=1759083 RepID=UPI0012E3C765|nr:hypothetical protein [Sphingopyxis sp. A083]
MSEGIIRKSLPDMLRAAVSRGLPQGWVYLPDGEITVASDCVLIADEAYQDEEELGVIGRQLGFPREGLDTQTIEDVCDAAARLSASPDDEVCVQAFVYYWKFDAYLPSLGAPDPLPADIVLRELDREFYDSLGEERAASRCRREGCERGAVNMSAFCRKHHFEMVRLRPCIFE